MAKIDYPARWERKKYQTGQIQVSISMKNLHSLGGIADYIAILYTNKVENKRYL